MTATSSSPPAARAAARRLGVERNDLGLPFDPLAMCRLTRPFPYPTFDLRAFQGVERIMAETSRLVRHSLRRAAVLEHLRERLRTVPEYWAARTAQVNAWGYIDARDVAPPAAKRWRRALPVAPPYHRRGRLHHEPPSRELMRRSSPKPRSARSWRVRDAARHRPRQRAVRLVPAPFLARPRRAMDPAAGAPVTTTGMGFTEVS